MPVARSRRRRSRATSASSGSRRRPTRSAGRATCCPAGSGAPIRARRWPRCSASSGCSATAAQNIVVVQSELGSAPAIARAARSARSTRRSSARSPATTRARSRARSRCERVARSCGGSAERQLAPSQRPRSRRSRTPSCDVDACQARATQPLEDVGSVAEDLLTLPDVLAVGPTTSQPLDHEPRPVAASDVAATYQTGPASDGPRVGQGARIRMPRIPSSSSRSRQRCAISGEAP